MVCSLRQHEVRLRACWRPARDTGTYRPKDSGRRRRNDRISSSWPVPRSYTQPFSLLAAVPSACIAPNLERTLVPMCRFGLHNVQPTILWICPFAERLPVLFSGGGSQRAAPFHLQAWFAFIVRCRADRILPTARRGAETNYEARRAESQPGASAPRNGSATRGRFRGRWRDPRDMALPMLNQTPRRIRLPTKDIA